MLALLTAGMVALVTMFPPVRGADAPTDMERGLSLTFQSLEGGRMVRDTRPARVIALYVREGKSPTPLLPPGRFKAIWTGELNLRIRDRMSFSAEGRGKVTISVKGKVVFEASGDDLSKVAGQVVRLDKGPNPLVVTYESPPKGDAYLRVHWKEQKGLRSEAVPPTVFTHDPAAEGEAEGRRLRKGRQLIAELRCTKCHAAGEAAAGGMPELAMDAPSLTDVGARLNREWIAAWVADPRSFRKDAHMPRVFPGLDRGDTVVDPRPADVAAYLATLGRSAGSTQSINRTLVPGGGQFFASLNCVACHMPPDAAAPTAREDRVALAPVNAKFRPNGLVRYLLDPTAHYAWNPMPNFKLSGEEAESLAAFLMTKAQGKVPESPAGDEASGQQLVRSSGCLNCHVLEKETTSLKAPDLAAMPAASWNRGCMAADPATRKNAPDFGLSNEQRDALLAFAATDRSSLARDDPAEFSARQVAAMRCAACHARDGNESLIGTDFAADQASLTATYPPPQAAPGAESRGEIFAPDQRPPLLTWAGEKLRPEWAIAFIAGKIDDKPRPYLRARMPAWPTRAEGLAKGLAAEHGYGPTSPAYPAPDEAMAAVGQKLIGSVGGFSCVQCHAVAAQPPLAPFEAPALNFAHTSERLRKDHYLRWVFNPIKVDPATKMPAFADADGKSALRDVFDGDAGKQFEAIWQFLLCGKDVKAPAR